MPDFSRLATRVRGLSRVEKNFAQRGCSAWADLCQPRHLLISVSRLFFVCVLQLFVRFLEAEIVRDLLRPHFFTTVSSRQRTIFCCALIVTVCIALRCRLRFLFCPLLLPAEFLATDVLFTLQSSQTFTAHPLVFPIQCAGARARACVCVCVCVCVCSL